MWPSKWRTRRRPSLDSSRLECVADEWEELAVLEELDDELE
jgi:hypothetical protein